MVLDLRTAVFSTWIGAVIAIAVIAAVSVLAVFSSNQSAHDTDVNAVSTYSQQAIDDKQTSKSLFIPVSDLNGAANTDGHAFDFYSQDSHWNAHFLEACYRAASNDCPVGQPMNTLQIYGYASWTALTRNGGGNAGVAAVEQPLYGFSGINISQVDGGSALSNLPEVKNFPGGLACSNTVYHWAYPGVTNATCRVYALTIKTGTDTATVYLADSAIPFQQTVINGTATPTPNPMAINPQPLSFRAPIAAAQSATVTESNYGTRTTTPAQQYALANGCSATVSPSSPVSPSNNGTGTATLSVLPTLVALPGGQSCNITVTDNVSQSKTLPVTIGQTFTPAAVGITISFSPGATAPVAVTEQNYDVPVPSGRGGFVFAGYLLNGSQPLTNTTASDPRGVCSNSARVGSPSMGNPNFTEGESWQITFAKAGVCFPVFMDVYGQRVAVNGASGLVALAPLLVWPQYVVYGQSGQNVADARGHNRVQRDIVASTLTALLGGATANAAGTCPAIAMQPDMQTPDTNPPAWVSLASIGWYTTTGASPGCFNGDVTANEQGYSGLFLAGAGNCGASLRFLAWSPSQTGPTAMLLTQGASAGSCAFPMTDSGSGSKNVQAIVTNLNQCAIGAHCLIGGDVEQNIPCDIDPTLGGGTIAATDTTNPTWLAGAGLGTAYSDGTNWYFIRSAYGFVQIELIDHWTRGSEHYNSVTKTYSCSAMGGGAGNAIVANTSFY